MSTQKIAFVFPGQGSQAVGMGKSFLEESTLGPKLFEEANAVLGFDLAAVCVGGPLEKLTQTEITQPAILTVSLIALGLLREAGITPAMTAGHSLGEYAAHAAAETFSVSDAIRLTQLRGRYMAEACRSGGGTMVAILSLADEKLAEIVQQIGGEGVLDIANMNAPGQVVLSGEQRLVQKATEACQAAGGRAIPLTVGGAFHSRLMAPAAERLSQVLATATVQAPRLPVFSNVTALPVTTPEEVRTTLAQQVTSPVRWTQTIQNMIQQGVTMVVEVGPGKVLSGLIRKIDRSVKVLSVSDIPSLAAAQEALAAQKASHAAS